MWERRLKSSVGQVERVYKDNDSILKRTTFDSLEPGGFNYNKANLKVEYTVESLDKKNLEAFERSQRVDNDLEPWELFDEYLTDSLGLAIQEVLIRTFDPNCPLEPTFNMYIKTPNGDAEVMADIPSTLRHTIRGLVDKDMRQKIDAKEKEIEMYKQELISMQAFIKHANAEKLYEEWRRGEQ